MTSDAENDGDEALRAIIERWIAEDPDPGCRAELEGMLAANAWSALRARFAGLLEFGTAGLRAELGAGPSRINRAVVARATAALCAHLHEQVANAEQRGICIGFDGRRMSREFAEETAAVAAGAGFRVALFAAQVPTPLLAFAVLDRHAAAGVMITASHNPARDNGFKVYWENAAQLIPPHDRAIFARMRAMTCARSLPRMAAAERAAWARHQTLGSEFEQRYLAGVAAANQPVAAGPRPLRIAYTALHGVGERFVRAALGRAGFAIESVAEQARPDPDFPSVAFPNPEEIGVMDRVCALAERIGADLALANDPDADRLAVAARDGQGRMRSLTGNQVGVLLAEHLLSSSSGDGSRQRLVLSSIVSTPMIAEIAREHDAMWEPTLTGFKWICNRALQLERQRSVQSVFAFEEALGYCIGSLVRDKDGISSAVAVANLAAALQRENRTLHDALQRLFRRHGVHQSCQLAMRSDGTDGRQRIVAFMADARRQPPQAIAGHTVRAIVDLLDGSVQGTPSFHSELPSSDVLLWELESGHRVVLRPSGTEPKLKVYVDVKESVADAETIEAAEARAQHTIASLCAAMRGRLC